MGILEELEQMIQEHAADDLVKIKAEWTKQLPGLFPALNKNMTGGKTSKQKVKGSGYKGGSAQGTAQGTAQTKNGTRNGTRNAMVAKSNPARKTLTLLFLSVVILESLSRVRQILPLGMSLIQVLSLYGKEGFLRVVMPFMGRVEKTFTFMASTTLPNVKEGLYMKMMSTLNGEDARADPNRFFATLGNLTKVSSWMSSFFSTVLGLVYEAKPVLKNEEVGPLLKDILKTVEEKVTKETKYNYMEIPAKSILMTPA